MYSLSWRLYFKSFALTLVKCKKNFLNLMLLILCFFSVNVWADNKPDTLKRAQIKKILDNWRARSGIPTIALSIFLPNDDHPITIASGTGSYKNNVKPKIDPLFQAGSITKSFTAMIILQLEAQKKIEYK